MTPPIPSAVLRLKELLAKSAKGPWKGTEWEVEAPYIYGADGDSILAMLWPAHPPEQTRWAEVQTYTTCDLIVELRNQAEFLIAAAEKSERYRLALSNIVNILGPKQIPDCCEGAKAEMEAALENAVQALQGSAGEGR